MAESDTRLETLEDEVKVLKGEVKRTLVDLRALLMREDSPLGDGALGRRIVMPDRGADGETAHRREVTATAGPPAVPMEAAPGPGAFPGSPPQAGPGGFPGAASPPIVIQQGGPPPGPQPQPAADLVALAEQERRMAEQERRMAEQERKIAEQKRNLANASRPEQPGPPRDEYHHPPEKREQASHQITENTGQVTPGKNGLDRPPQEDQGTDRAGQPVSQNGWKDLAEAKSVAGPQGKKGAEQPPASPERHQRANSVYDEYRELLEESKEVYPAEDTADIPAGPPLDMNLLSNLVYWVALAKQKVGEQRLKDILELYIKSGHSRPELRDLLLHISNLVDAAPVSVSPNTGEWVDLMFHLHGILTGSFPVIKIPQIRLPGQGESGPDGS
jgi:hypothetical protein